VNLYRRLLGYLRPYVWPHGIVAVIAMLTFTAVEGSVPFVAKYTFDQVFTQRHLDALPFAVVAVWPSRCCGAASTSAPDT
jgi:hypothetical protein